MILRKSTRLAALAAAAAVSFSALAIDQDLASGGSPLPPVGHASAPAYGGATVAPAPQTLGYAGGQRAWERLDRNADGFITRNEASAEQRLAAAFAGLDGDRDGKLSAMEFGATGTLAP